MRTDHYCSYENCAGQSGTEQPSTGTASRGAAWKDPPVQSTVSVAAVLGLGDRDRRRRRLVFGVPLRRTEGFVRANPDRGARRSRSSDLKTASRRSEWLDVAVQNVPSKGPQPRTFRPRATELKPKKPARPRASGGAGRCPAAPTPSRTRDPGWRENKDRHLNSVRRPETLIANVSASFTGSELVARWTSL